MARWKPDSRARLEQAAMELYAEHGFDRTTVADIANRAGLTERTFFRHFADKREVLFSGSEALEDALLAAVAAAPDSVSAIDAAAAGIEAAAAMLEDRRSREFARRRQTIIAGSAELRERELIKLASWAAGIADTLRRRGLAEPAASLTAEVAMAVFRIAFTQWIEQADDQDLRAKIRESLDELNVLVASDDGSGTSTSRTALAATRP
jgi:AcrR family transcriptional regulator